MPQTKELSFPPLHYQPPQYSEGRCNATIEDLTHRNDAYLRAIEVIDVLRDRISPLPPSSAELGTWFPNDETDMLVWSSMLLMRGYDRLRDTSRYYSYENLRSYFRERRDTVSSMVSDNNHSLRMWHQHLQRAQEPAPAAIVLKRDALRSELKGIRQIPLRSVNLALIQGAPYLTWTFHNVMCKPNETSVENQIYGLNAGDVPAFPLPRMAFSMPLDRLGRVRVKPLRGESRYHAFSSNSVHPHHMSDRHFCLGDYSATMEELKMKHDFVGLILLYLDFVSKCEPTDGAGRTYPSFIQQQIINQIGVSVAMHYPTTLDAQFVPKSTLKLRLSSQVNALRSPGGPHHNLLTGRVARLRGQWVFQPTENIPEHWTFTRVSTYAETCAMRDQFTCEKMRAFFAKDEDEYALLARMVTENVPIQYNEATNLVLNALLDEDVSSDDDNWCDHDALPNDSDDYDAPTAENEDTEDTEDTDDEDLLNELTDNEAPEPYVDEPY